MEMIIMFIIGVFILFIVIENGVRLSINHSVIGKRYSEIEREKALVNQEIKDDSV